MRLPAFSVKKKCKLVRAGWTWPDNITFLPENRSPQEKKASVNRSMPTKRTVQDVTTTSGSRGCHFTHGSCWIPGSSWINFGITDWLYKAFVGGLDQCGILGGSCCISSVSVSYGVCKTPESNMSLQVLLIELKALSGGFLLWWCHEMTLLPSFPFANTFLAWQIYFR